MSNERQSRIDTNSSTTPKPSPTSNSSEKNSSTNQNKKSTRPQSEFPTPNEPVASLSLQSTRSETEQPKRRRCGISSIVPDSAVLRPINRPDDHGTVGTPIEIYTNHFPVSIDDAIIINQYHIKICMLRDGCQPCPATKYERWEVVEMLRKHEKNFPIVWYDAENYLYTTKLLTGFTKPLRVKLTINDIEISFEFEVMCRLVRQEKISNIFDFINGKTKIRPRDLIKMIDTLFEQNVHNQYVCIRNKYYDRCQTLLDLKDGIGLASGFRQALCLTRCGLTINGDLAFTSFYQPLNFIDFACQYLDRNIRNGFNQYELDDLRRLQNIPVKTTHTGRTIQYRLKNFGLAANQLKFNLRCQDDWAGASITKEITVAGYFARKYKNLNFPHLPCIDIRNGQEEREHWLPMETVEIVEWTRPMGPLNSIQQAAVAQRASVKPDQRYDEIMHMANQRDCKNDSYLQALNIRVNTDEMLKIQARILPPPEIKYRARNNQDVVEQVKFGKWKIRNQFQSTATIYKWGIVYFGSEANSDIRKILSLFKQQLPSLLRNYGIRINSDPLTREVPCDRDKIDSALTCAKREGWQLAIVVLNDTDPAVYNYIKKLGNQMLGLITQCTSFQALQKNSPNLDQYVRNLSQKVNAKIGGINGIVNLKAALSQTSDKDRFMFFGANVTHTSSSTSQPSIATVVGSCDPTCSRYAVRLCKQYSYSNCCSTGIIKKMDTMIIDLLKLYARSCGDTLPNRIVFYRDGMDDEQLQNVFNNEIMKIKAACRDVYGQNPLPRITFIIVNKRHNTRFFTYDGQKANNVQAGTVVDRDITHPFEFDFFLCSQAPKLGTSRPALYHVVQDENKFSSDEIQKLTYWLCHTDVRCSKSVSIPAPIHYAHLAANASDAYDFDADDYEVFKNEGDDHIQTQLMILDDNIQDTMWFV
ncbi:unnamed protein product [Rotaria magnacalcarata]|uniref:Uncharacterized protein n=1 Tax=Rotaria magnacalcarata TaxID=392030 RepID=A0A816YLX6_9BILA|nr:unnamed protein product [Rotaria magnacalcarata]CAF2162044.1 unnamed protein product [Rotaria magnacalcarata]CAF3790847.1 unnamed protein product [Rotaria magnacalcarata]